MPKLRFAHPFWGPSPVVFFLWALHAQTPATRAAQPSGLQAGQSTAYSSADARSEMEAAIARQRTTTAAMQESLARQLASVQQQVAQTATGSFFVLPPPLTLGATVATPASHGTFADCDPLPSAQVDTLVGEAAKRQHLEEDVLREVMRQESAFRPCAVSPKGAVGLMQLMPATADRYGVQHPFDPVENVEAGAKLLKDLLSRYNDDLTMALGAYNAGAAKVEAAEGVPKIPETQDYVQKIISNLPAKQQ